MRLADGATVTGAGKGRRGFMCRAMSSSREVAPVTQALVATNRSGSAARRHSVCQRL